MGIWHLEAKPIRVLAHGRKARNLVRSSSEELSDVLWWILKGIGEILRVLMTPSFRTGTITRGQLLKPATP